MRERLDARAQAALIEVEARLLSELERHAKAQPPLAKLERRERRIARDHARAWLEALRLGGALGRAVDDGPRTERLQRRQHGRLAALDADRAELQREHVTQPIHDEPWQVVPLRVHEAERVGIVAR